MSAFALKFFHGIEKTLGVCGGDARIANTRIPVWVLVQARNLGNTEAQILANYPTISAIDLSNAWRYAEAHLREIEQAVPTARQSHRRK
ncbi:DUF433 domain-containing protein [Leptolyngbya sp. NIES-2104]|uniref:DUF433 domain-containing protein n=1 Tax=Leptolyngbya sp. NIES-2104 TaxID=1552121 RepID=UPI0006EC69E2|nr:DUF433 domain-containing protein [Leptolyngbya sp. NIES-2104]GAP99692.1 DUF433 domain-containing protein [Leptolyngbya sp. NIES-2104]